MSTILDQLAEHARERVAADRERVPLETLKQQCLSGDVPKRIPFAFEAALKKPGLSFICEIKKASPSKGVIAEAFHYLDIALDYAAAGADAISCLTEPKWFLGSDRTFTDVRAAVELPMLRKDFTVNEYQIYQAKLMGADAVLLICAILSADEIRRYFSLCDELGLSALVEAHDATEIETAISAGARIIGVNNRNLKDFSVDTGNSRRLKELVPAGVLFVSESGIQSAEDVRLLRESGVDAALIGEALMRASDKKAMLDRFRGAV
jgi:indole-3-glycerol phosphate synthase